MACTLAILVLELLAEPLALFTFPQDLSFIFKLARH